MASQSNVADAVVIGAGLVGMATARELAGRGLSVTVVESRTPGAGASTAGAGLLSPISDWDSTRPFIEICRRARDGWKPWLAELVTESGVAVEHDEDGALLVALSERELPGLDVEQRIAARAGEACSEVTPAEAIARVPDLSRDAIRVLHLPGEHRVDNVAACAALARACALRGVAMRERFTVRALRQRGADTLVEGEGESITAPIVVLASGAWSAGIEGAGALPVRPVRGQMLRLEGTRWPWGGSLRLGHNYVVRRGASGLLVGATVEEAGFADHPTVAGIEELLAFARSLFPSLAGARVESIWAGLRPGSPDGRPILGRIPWAAGARVVAACGHYRNGILLAPWTGREIAAHLVDGRPIEEGALFSPERFQDRTAAAS